MAAHARWLLSLLIPLCMGAPVSSQQAAAPAPQPSDPLSRTAEVVLQDADLPTALRALRASCGVAACYEGAVPDRTLTLTVKDTPVRDILDGLAGLYGLQWKRKLTMVVFSPRGKDAPDAKAPAPAGDAPAAQGAPGSEGGAPIPGGAAAAPTARPGVPRAEGAQDGTDQGIGALRQLGFGYGTEPPLLRGTPQHVAAIQQLTGYFSPAQLQQMAQAGARADAFGIPAYQLPAGLQSLLLQWQADLHHEQARWYMWQAARPFDQSKFLNSLVFVSFAPDPDGLPRRMPSLVLKGNDWSNNYPVLIPR